MKNGDILDKDGNDADTESVQESRPESALDDEVPQFGEPTIIIHPPETDNEENRNHESDHKDLEQEHKNEGENEPSPPIERSNTIISGNIKK